MPTNSIPTFDCLVAFGANQGDTRAALAAAVTSLSTIDQISELQSSQPLVTRAVTGDRDRDADADQYLNAALRFKTTFAAEELHAAIIAIEQQLGRQREHRWGPRTIDLDLLLYGDQQIDTPELHVPHPRMSFRRFVLQPAADVAAEMIHPVCGLSIQQLLTHLETREPVVLISTDDLRSVLAAMTDLGDDDGRSIVVVDDPSEFIRHSPAAMLSVSWFEEASTHPLVRYAENFCGPMLRLSATDGIDRNVTEIAAAIQAMTK